MKRGSIHKNCLICHKDIWTTQYRIGRGQDKYCSRKCFYKSREGKNTVPWLNIKGRKVWNKGTHIQTNSGRTHFKKGQIGWSRGKKRPEISAMFKGIRPEKAIESAKIANMGNKYRLGKKHSEETRKKVSATKLGVDINNWNGFTMNLNHALRETPEYELWQKMCFQRDNYRCVVCGGSKILNVDHRISFSQLIQEAVDLYGFGLDKVRNYISLWDTTNGRVLCKKCHEDRKSVV